MRTKAKLIATILIAIPTFSGMLFQLLVAQDYWEDNGAFIKYLCCEKLDNKLGAFTSIPAAICIGLTVICILFYFVDVFQKWHKIDLVRKEQQSYREAKENYIRMTKEFSDKHLKNNQVE